MERIIDRMCDSGSDLRAAVQLIKRFLIIHWPFSSEEHSGNLRMKDQKRTVTLPLTLSSTEDNG